MQSNVNIRELQIGDLVLRKNIGSMVDPRHGKLVANWEGPYLVNGTTGTGANYLQDKDDKEIQNPWNISNLRRYYH